MNIPGRDADGIYLALDFLHGSDPQNPDKYNAKGKKVLIIGGGDTGNDRVGKSLREGCVPATPITKVANAAGMCLPSSSL